MAETPTDAESKQSGGMNQAQIDAASGSSSADSEQEEAAREQDLSLKEADLPDFRESEAGGAPVHSIDLLHDVNLKVRIELGRTRMYVEDVLRLGEGSVVELNRLAGDPVDVFVNNRLVARGEVLVLNDNFCVRVGEIISDDNERLVG